MYMAEIKISFKSCVKDEEAEDVLTALRSYGYGRSAKSVKVSELVTIELDVTSHDEACGIVKHACEKLLADSTLEEYTFVVKEQTDGNV